MKVLVVIPILNPPKWFFDGVIGMLKGQTIKPQIVLINSGDAIPGGDYEVINISKKEFNHANTRNIALGYEADYYLFMTQDATPCDSVLVENLLKSLENEDMAMSYARQVPYADADTIEVYARHTNYPEKSFIKSKADLADLGIKTFFSSDSCAMYDGAYFRNLNGFKKDLHTNEDMEFAFRAVMDGKKVAYCAEAKVYHSHHFSFKETYARYVQIGRFFTHNPCILEEVKQYKALESTGFRQVQNELQYLLKHAPLLIPKSVLLTAIKYLGYKLGQKYEKLPMWMIKKFSMHHRWWDKRKA